MRKVLVLYNPASGSCGFQQHLDAVTAACLERGYLPTFYRIGAGASREVLRAAGEYQALLVAGGDGTVSWVVDRLLDLAFDIPVGIVPSGTANDFASALGIGGDPAGVVARLLSGHQMHVDVGWVNGHHFINVVSAGALASVPLEVNRRLKKRLGITAYYLEGLQQLRNMDAVPVTVETDQFSFREEVVLLLVMNSPTVGTFRNIAPQADITDGLLDVMLVRKCSLAQVVALLVEVFRGEGKHLNSPYVECFPARIMRVASPVPVSTDIDGEPGPALPLEIRVLPQRVRLLVPGRAGGGLDNGSYDI